MSFHDLANDPKSSVSLVSEMSEVLIATEARLESAALAPAVRQLPSASR